jgi:hypothetical protein
MNGAIDSVGNFILPSFANKGNAYTCPDCSKGVFLRKGEVNKPHFAHYSDKNPCTFYERTGESADHKNGKLLIRNMLEQKRHIIIERKCYSCRTSVDFVVPVDELTDIREEYPLENHRRADVGCKFADGSLLVFEVLHTSKTSESNRGGIWFELSTDELLNKYNHTGSLKFECSRNLRCTSCEEAENKLIQDMKERAERATCERIKREQFMIEKRIREKEQKAIALEEERLRKLALEEETRKIEIENNRLETIKRQEQDKQRQIEFAEWKRQREEEYKQRQIEYEKEKQEHRQIQIEKAEQRKKEKEAKLEQERLYNEIHIEYLKEVVEAHVYDPTATYDSGIQYKGFEFLHPHHVWRMRHSRKK